MVEKELQQEDDEPQMINTIAVDDKKSDRLEDIDDKDTDQKSLKATKQFAQTKLLAAPDGKGITSTTGVAQHQIKMKAYALLRFIGKDIPLTAKEALLGRDPFATTKSRDNKNQNNPIHVSISDSTRVSRIACRIYLD